MAPTRPASTTSSNWPDRADQVLHSALNYRAPSPRFPLSSMKITFIGGGNMAGALIGGLLKNGYAAAEIGVVEVDPAAGNRLSARFDVAVDTQPGTRVVDSDVIVLAVKPQQLRPAAQALAALLKSQLLVSIAAGIRTADLSRWLGGYSRIVRVMPNTPAVVLAGVSALYALPAVTAEERRIAQAILAAVGSTLWVDREDLMDAV